MANKTRVTTYRGERIILHEVINGIGARQWRGILEGEHRVLAVGRQGSSWFAMSWPGVTIWDEGDPRSTLFHTGPATNSIDRAVEQLGLRDDLRSETHAEADKCDEPEDTREDQPQHDPAYWRERMEE